MELHIPTANNDVTTHHVDGSQLYDPNSLSPYSISTTSSSTSPGTSSAIHGMMYPEYSEWNMHGMESQHRQPELPPYGHQYVGYNHVGHAQPELLTPASYWPSDAGVGQGMSSYPPMDRLAYPTDYNSVQGSLVGQATSPCSTSSSNGVGKSGKPKRKRVQSVPQRKAANIRERRRMFHLNEAFDTLRKRLPAFNYEKRLSRIETLRLAMTYIAFMKDVSDGDDPQNVKLQGFKDMIESSMFRDLNGSDETSSMDGM